MQWDFRERARATKDFLKCLDEGDNQIIISDNDSGYYVGCLIKIAQDYGYTRQNSGMVVDATLYKFVPGEFNRFLEANGSYNRRLKLGVNLFMTIISVLFLCSILVAEGGIDVEWCI